MKPEIKFWFVYPGKGETELRPVESLQFPDPEDVAMTTMIEIGVEGDENFTEYSLDIYTLKALPRVFATKWHSQIIGSGSLVMERYEYSDIKEYIDRILDRIEGANKHEIMDQLRVHFGWENELVKGSVRHYYDIRNKHMRRELCD